MTVEDRGGGPGGSVAFPVGGERLDLAGGGNGGGGEMVFVTKGLAGLCTTLVVVGFLGFLDGRGGSYAFEVAGRYGAVGVFGGCVFVGGGGGGISDG